MAVSIKRNTGFMGSGIKMTVKINGEKVAKISQNQQIELEIPGDEATIRVSQLGIKSNEVKIKDGKKLEITTKDWMKNGLIFFLIALFLISIILNLAYIIIASLVLFILFTSIYFLIDGFQLQVKEFRAEKNIA